MHVYNYSRCETHYYSFSQEHHPFKWINRACKFWAEWHWISPEHFPHIKKQKGVRYFFFKSWIHVFLLWCCEYNGKGKLHWWFYCNNTETLQAYKKITKKKTEQKSPDTLSDVTESLKLISLILLFWNLSFLSSMLVMFFSLVISFHTLVYHV